MANDPLSRLASAIGLLTQEDDNMRAAALGGATKLLARHGLTWRDVGIIVAARLGDGTSATPAPAEPPKPKEQPRPRSAPVDPDEDPQERAWAEWRRQRGGGPPPKPRQRVRMTAEPQRRSGFNVPGEIFGRIVLRTHGRGVPLTFDVDDETTVYGPLSAFASLGSAISRADGRRIHAKVVPAQDRRSMPRVYFVDMM